MAEAAEMLGVTQRTFAAGVVAMTPREETKRTFYVSTSFCGCPIGWRFASSPNRAAVTVFDAADPNGTSRCMLCWKRGRLGRGCDYSMMRTAPSAFVENWMRSI